MIENRMDPKGREMGRLRIYGLVASLAFVSTAAFAFQEQQATAPRAQETTTQPAPAALGPDAVPAARGTPVRIPGLGTLGMIPRLDLGLDLLYGAAEPPTKRTDPSKPDQDDVLVGGRIKHRF
jgi:hypothetical protein